MPSYRVRPTSIPKHLKIPQQALPPRTTLNPAARPPIRGSTSPDNATPAMTSLLTGYREGAASFWSRKNNTATDNRNRHPHAKLRDPLSLRIFDMVAKSSIPGTQVFLSM